MLVGATCADTDDVPRAPGAASRLFFDARLTPNRSLGTRGFAVMMGVVGGTSFGFGLAMALLGAWPVLAFFGLDVALVYLAFRANYRSGRAYEAVTLTDSDLVVRRVDPRGGERVWRFEPSWLKVDMATPPEHGSPLTVGARGRSLEIGAFLTPEERLEVAHALRAALQERRRALIGARPL